MESLGRYREPGLLFGGGLLAGLMLFLAWLAFSSSPDVDSQATEPEAAANAAQQLPAGRTGALSGITGGSASGQARAVSSPSVTTAEPQPANASAGKDGAPTGGAADAPTGAVSDGEAITSGLFGPEPPSAEAVPEAAPEDVVSEPATDQ
jgi:hypothetical protein